MEIMTLALKKCTSFKPGISWTALHHGWLTSRMFGVLIISDFQGIKQLSLTCCWTALWTTRPISRQNCPVQSPAGKQSKNKNIKYLKIFLSSEHNFQIQGGQDWFWRKGEHIRIVRSVRSERGRECFQTWSWSENSRHTIWRNNWSGERVTLGHHPTFHFMRHISRSLQTNIFRGSTKYNSMNNAEDYCHC